MTPGHRVGPSSGGVAQATATAVALCCLAGSPAMAADQAAAAAPVEGEFHNACVMSLAEGHPVITDCTVNWTDSDGKVYCFSTQASRTVFLANPAETLQKAREFELAKDVAATEAAVDQPRRVELRAPSSRHLPKTT